MPSIPVGLQWVIFIAQRSFPIHEDNTVIDSIKILPAVVYGSENFLHNYIQRRQSKTKNVKKQNNNKKKECSIKKND